MEQDEYLAHEALDRAAMLCDTFDSYVSEHPYVKGDKELAAIAEKAVDAMYAVYNAIAKRHL